MIIFPEDLLPPLPGLEVERLTLNPELNDPKNRELIGSYVVQNNDTKLWQAIRVKIDHTFSRPERVKITKRGRWVKGGHTAIAHARKFEKLDG
jgi:hypothetical protein